MLGAFAFHCGHLFGLYKVIINHRGAEIEIVSVHLSVRAGGECLMCRPTNHVFFAGFAFSAVQKEQEKSRAFDVIALGHRIFIFPEQLGSIIRVVQQRRFLRRVFQCVHD